MKIDMTMSIMVGGKSVFKVELRVLYYYRSTPKVFKSFYTR